MHSTLQATASHYFRPMRGRSQCHLLLADHRLYVVKFAQNPVSTRSLANEWLATALAQHVGLPAADCSIIHVTEEFARDNSQLKAESRGVEVAYKAGRHYGSLLLGSLMPGSAFDYLPRSEAHKVANRSDFAGALAFDKWTCNADGRQCIFTPTGKRIGSYQVTFIDHGHSFDHDWAFRDAPLKGSYGDKSVYHEVAGRSSFEPWLTRIEELPEDTLREAAASIPPEWYDSNSMALESLVSKLLARRQRVWELLLETRATSPAHFPLWVS